MHTAILIACLFAPLVAVALIVTFGEGTRRSCR